MVGIYKITNIINNKCYIGQSKDINDRWTRHICELNANRHINKHLQSAWNKYSKDSFIFSILEECHESDLNQKEKFYIQQYDSVKNGYNLDYGGDGITGFKHTEEQIIKMRLIQQPFEVMQFDLNFNLINTYYSVSHAAKFNNYTTNSIRDRCNHKTTYHNTQITYKNNYWVYAYEYNNINFSWDNYLNNQWSCVPKSKSNHKYYNQKIIQYTLDKKIVKIWDSFTDIENAGYTRNQVCTICNKRKGKRTHKNYIWAYEGYDFSDGYFDNLENKHSTCNRRKIILQLNDDYKIINEFESLSKTNEYFAHKQTSTIGRAIKNHTKIYGYYFAYKDDPWYNILITK